MGYCGELAVEKQVQIPDTFFYFPWQLPCFGMLVFRIGANSEEEENCSELKKPGNKSGYLHGKQSNFLIQHLKSQGQWNPITKEQDETWVLSCLPRFYLTHVKHSNLTESSNPYCVLNKARPLFNDRAKTWCIYPNLDTFFYF